METDETVFAQTIAIDQHHHYYDADIFYDCNSDYDNFLAKYIYYTRFNDVENLSVMNTHLCNCVILINLIKNINSETPEYMLDFYEEHIGSFYSDRFTKSTTDVIISDL